MKTCKTIAECGWSHLGNMHIAKGMIEAAAEAGADYVKFQSWSVKNLKPGPWDTDGRRQIYEKAELSDENYKFLLEKCGENKIEFLTSVFSVEDAIKVSKFCTKVKIPSSEINNLEMLKVVRDNYKEVFMSTGASTFEEIGQAVDILSKKELTLLHCVSSYPCDAKACNLHKIWDLKALYPQCDVGYSGHALGIYDAIAALEFNVQLIEKHFTIDNDLPGRDNKFAVLPTEFRFLCHYIKQREYMLEYTDGYNKCEQEVRDVYRGRWQG